jgi:cytochrome c biogenesis protein
LFASDIVLIDHATGAKIPARVEVNKPFVYKGVAIYQSSFQDGGSMLQFTAYPMTGPTSNTAPFTGGIGASKSLGALDNGETVEFTDFRAINVENVANGSGSTDARGVAHQSLKQAFDERLGSGAKTNQPTDLRNVGASVQFKVRDHAGQAREYNNYMLPVEVGGERMFLAGMRQNPEDPFRYLRIPADEGNSVKEWMILRAALQTPSMREEAAKRFAARAVGASNAPLRQHLQESALRVLSLFAGGSTTGAPTGGATGGPATPASQSSGGFPAIATFIDQSVPKAEQQKAAELLLRMLEGATWDLWQLARAQAGEAPAKVDEQTSRFVQSSINALSDSVFYGAPVYLQLDSFRQVQASVFQVTRGPGKNLVYLGSLFLVLGIFSMFYVRERRVWFWLKDEDAAMPGGAKRTRVLMAMSTARKTFEFDKEFAHMRDVAGAALGVRALDGASGAPVARPSRN